MSWGRTFEDAIVPATNCALLIVGEVNVLAGEFGVYQDSVARNAMHNVFYLGVPNHNACLDHDDALAMTNQHFYCDFWILGFGVSQIYYCSGYAVGYFVRVLWFYFLKDFLLLLFLISIVYISDMLFVPS